MPPYAAFQRRSRVAALVLPLVFFLLCLAILWGAIRYSRQARLADVRQETAVTAEQVKLRLEAWVDNRTAILRHVASPTSGHHRIRNDEFAAIATEIVALYPGFQAINYIDPQWVIRIVVPAETNQAALDKDLHHHPDSRVADAVREAIADEDIRRSPLIDLLQGQPGFATYLPMRDEEGALEGLVNGVFVMDKLVNSCLGEEKLRSRFAITISTLDGEATYASRPEGMKAPSPDLEVTVPVRIVDKDWVLTLEPALAQAGTVHRGEGPLLAGGLLLALALSALLRAYLLRVAELAASREDYKMLIEAQQEIVVKLDENLRIYFMSPAGAQLLQKPAEEIIGHSPYEFIEEEDRAIVRSYLDDLKRGQKPEITDFRLATPSGPLWTSWTSTTILDEKGALRSMVAVGRDITRHRDLEQQLQRGQKLQAVGQLAGGIAHDFNNIIQAILGYLGFAKAGLDTSSEEYEDLEQAELAAERAATLTRQLLAFSRRQALQPVLLDLNRVTADLLPMLRRLLGEGIDLAFHPGPGSPLIRADRGQIEQILVNLCVNARDAIADDAGSISISTSREEMDEEFCRQHHWARPGDWVRLSLTDSGSGMDEEVLAQIFEPFYTTKETGQGTGLGLATVYGIIKQHEGLIDVSSRPGEGSIFTIYLPARQGEAAADAEAPVAAPATGKGTILLAEDEHMVRDLTTRTLEKAGYRVLTAADGQEALDIWRQRRDAIDLLVLDVVMPRLGGRQVGRRIEAERPGTPLVFISGFDAENSRSPVELPPHHAALAKPFSPQEILQAVSQVQETGGNVNGTPAPPER